MPFEFIGNIKRNYLNKNLKSLRKTSPDYRPILVGALPAMSGIGGRAITPPLLLSLICGPQSGKTAKTAINLRFELKNPSWEIFTYSTFREKIFHKFLHSTLKLFFWETSIYMQLDL